MFIDTKTHQYFYWTVIIKLLPGVTSGTHILHHALIFISINFTYKKVTKKTVKYYKVFVIDIAKGKRTVIYLYDTYIYILREYFCL